MLVIEAVLIIGYLLAQSFEILFGFIPALASYSAVLFIFFMLIIIAISFFCIKKWPILKRNNKTALVIGHLLLYGAIFVSYGKLETHYASMGMSIYGRDMSISFLNLAFVFVMALISAFFIPAMMDAPYMQKYLKKRYLVSMLCISAYAAFAVFGDSLFFQEPISLVTLMVYCLGVLWIFPITFEVLALYELICSHIRASQAENRHSNRFVWFVSFGIFVAIWLIYLVAYNPAQMSSDSIGMWRQAISGEKIGYLSFPTIDILLVRWLTYIVPHPAFIALIQILSFAVLCSFFMVEYYKQRIPIRVIVVFSAIFAVLPPNGLMITTLWSNIPYTFSLLYLTYAIHRLFSPDKGKTLPYINVALSLVLTYSTRGTGFIPVSFCVVLFIIFSLKKGFRKKLFAATVIGGVLIFLVQGPLYAAVREEGVLSPVESFTMIDGLQGVVYYGGSLPADAQAFLESVMPLEEWRDAYSEYDRDSKAYPAELRILAQQEGFTADIFGYYVDTLKQEPWLLIKNRLAKSNLVWGVTQPKGSYNERCMTWTFSDKIGFSHQKNLLGTIITKLVYPVSIALAPLDILLYRSGLYLILLLILCVFLMSYRTFRTGCMFVPILGDTIALLLAMAWPCFRHIWFVPVIFLLIVPLILSQVTNSGNEQGSGMQPDLGYHVVIFPEKQVKS